MRKNNHNIHQAPYQAPESVTLMLCTEEPCLQGGSPYNSDNNERLLHDDYFITDYETDF